MTDHTDNRDLLFQERQNAEAVVEKLVAAIKAHHDAMSAVEDGMPWEKLSELLDARDRELYAAGEKYEVWLERNVYAFEKP